jgi:hypothetical protein
MKNVTIILQSGTGKGFDFSLEAGLSDGEKHFDHHRVHSNNPCPANDPRIPVVPSGSIKVTHIDADTFVGLLRMLGKNLPILSYDLLEKIDLNGSSVVGEFTYTQTLTYMVGISELSREVGVPRVTENPQDITNLIEKMIETPQEKIEYLGVMAIKEGEAAYQDCKVDSLRECGFWVIGPDDKFDPSRPYQDGYNAVVVYRKHYESISIYAAPQCDWEFAGKRYGGIEFQGHPKACGSHPRSKKCTEEDAQLVFNYVCGRIT